MGAWLKEAIAILRGATPKWAASLLGVLFAGSLVADNYYVRISEWLELNGSGWVVDIVESTALLWVVIIVLAWPFGGLLHKTIKQRQINPRIFFDDVRVVDAHLNYGDDSHEPIEFVRIAIRNDPVSDRGDKLSKAYCTATFFNDSGEVQLLRVEFCRWFQNVKPRFDQTSAYFSRPQFHHEDNFCDIEPNNSRYEVDIVIFFVNGNRVYGLTGEDQLREWAVRERRLNGTEFLTRVEIKGNQKIIGGVLWLVISIEDRNLRVDELNQNLQILRENEWQEQHDNDAARQTSQP